MSFFNPTDAPDFVPGVGIGSGVLTVGVPLQIPINSAIWLPSAPGAGPAWYVGNTPATYFNITPGGNWQGSFHLDWYGDANTTQLVAQSFYNRSGQSNTMDMVSNPAPFLRVRFINSSLTEAMPLTVIMTAGVGSTGGAGIASSTSTQGRILGVFNSAAIAAGGTANVNANTNVPGPAIITLECGAGPAKATVQLLAGLNVGQQIGGITQTGTNNGIQSAAISLPNDDWELRVTNLGAASSTFMASVISTR